MLKRLKWPKSPNSTHRLAAIFTQLTLKIFDQTLCDPTHFTASSVNLNIIVELILAFVKCSGKL